MRYWIIVLREGIPILLWGIEGEEGGSADVRTGDQFICSGNQSPPSIVYNEEAVASYDWLPNTLPSHSSPEPTASSHTGDQGPKES